MAMLGWWGHLSFFQQGAAVSTLILTVGAIWEYWATLKHLPRLLLKVCLLRSSPFERCVLKRLLLHALPPIMVVAGIAGELVFETSDFIEENHKAADSDTNLRAARKEAADGLNIASQRLDAAKKELDAARLKLESEITGVNKNATQQADVLGKDLTSTKSQVDTVSKKLADRRLSVERQREIGSALRR